MLGKLFKYDNKALSKILFPLSIGVILLSILTTIILKSNLIFNQNFDDDGIIAIIVDISTIILTAFCIIAIISTTFISLFLILQRYYKNLFSDEGYLTFTLPVKTSHIILSKLFSAVIWQIVVAISVIIGVFIFIFFGTSAEFINPDVVNFFSEFFKILGNLDKLIPNIHTYDFILLPLEYIVWFIIANFTSFLLMFLSITLGNQLAKKHKILAAVGMYFAISAVVSTVTSAIETVCFITPISTEADILSNGLTFPYLIIIPSVIISIILGVGYFIANKYIIKNKLNLE